MHNNKKKRLVIKKTNPLGVIIILLFALAFLLGIALLAVSIFARYSHAYESIHSFKKPAMYCVSDSKEMIGEFETISFFMNGVEREFRLIKSFPKGFGKLSIQLRKRLFISAMLPIAIALKEQFEEEHKKIEKIKDIIDNGGILTDLQQRFLISMMKKYKTKNTKELIKRADSIPIGILIAQAAIESGWGSSRFTYMYNNIYGLHKRIVKPYKSIVRSFDSLYDATLSYIMNINTSPAYKKFRDARYMMGMKKNPYKLAEYLTMYSTKRDEYIKLIQNVISKNMLSFYDMYELHLHFILSIQ
jgi:Bax protein